MTTASTAVPSPVAPTTSTISHYAVLVDGKPLRLARKYNGNNRNCCGENTWTLVDADDYRYEDARPYRLADEADCRRFLRRGSTEWYNSDEEHPNWGSLKREQISFARYTETVTMEPVAINIPELMMLSDVVEDYYTTSVPGPIRKRFGLPEGKPGLDDTVVGAIVYVGKDGRFPVEQEEVRAKLTGREIGHGHRICTLLGVEPLDEHAYYIFLGQIDQIY